MIGISEPTQEQYIETLEDDLKAARAVIGALKELYIGAMLDDSGGTYCVSSSAFDTVMDLVEMLRE